MKYIYILLAMVGMSCFSMIQAQNVGGSGILVEKKSVTVSDGQMVMVGMDITVPADMKISSDRKLTLTPVIQAADGSANKVLPPVVFYGRRRSIVNQREGSIPEDAFEVIRRKNNTDQTVNYIARVPYEEWMHGASLELDADLCGCGNHVQEEDRLALMPINLVRYTIVPSIAFVTPQVEAVKNRAEEGSAFLDFPVNQVKIYPDFRKNPAELQKIRETIELVKNDSNTRITGIDIVGYASPEGGYKQNARLAQGRAEALKKYVSGLYEFEDNVISVSSVPEDWQGLRNYVAASSLPQKEELLAIIDNTQLDEDKRELELRKVDGGKVYAALLKDCYPALRHSDYAVHYVVREFSIEEAKEVIAKRPQQLSLDEMFRVAQTYESGSEEFNNVFEVAVRMFPEDPTANMNAAAIELQQGNWKQAGRYLQKSDADLAATKNNRGVLLMMQGNLDEAEALFNEAKAMGSVEAEKNLEEIVKKRKDIAIFGK